MVAHGVDYTKQKNLLKLLKFVSLCNALRNDLLSNHADDT